MNTLKDKAQQRAARVADRDFQRMTRMAAQLEAARREPTEWLPLGALRLDGGTQPRARLDERVVAEYAEAMAEGAEFPPVDVFYDGTDYWLADGFHRAAAARKAGLEDIEARVHQGTVRDAVLFSVGVNAAHGLRRTNEDKRRAVLRLLTDPEWGQWNDSEIARRCNVSQPFVSKLRAELSYNGYKIASDTRLVQRGGTVYEQRVSSEKRSQRAASKPTPRYVADPDFDQRVADDDETHASAPPRPQLPTARVRAEDEETVRRLADRLEAAIGELLRDGPLTMSGLLAGLRGARLDVDSQVGLAALRVALNRLLESGQVVRAGEKYWWYSPDETEEPEATAALGLAVGAMDALAAALDNVLALAVSDPVLRDPAVRQMLGALWDGFPPLREKLTQAEERVEALLRQSVDGILGGL